MQEAHLSEVKRRSELERTRGPTPGWWGLKGPTFFYEAHKNRKSLQVRGDIQALVRYRDELKRASSEFHDVYTAYTYTD